MPNSPIGKISFTKKELGLTIVATALALPSIFSVNPPIGWFTLGISWGACSYLCFAHKGSPRNRTISALIITAVFLVFGVYYGRTNAVARLMAAMERTAEQKGGELANHFPNGHLLFGIAGKKKIVPYRTLKGDILSVNWEVARVAGINENTLILVLPDIYVKGKPLVTGVTLESARITGNAIKIIEFNPDIIPGGIDNLAIETAGEVKAPLFAGPKPTMELVFEVVATEATGDELVLGLRPRTL